MRHLIRLIPIALVAAACGLQLPPQTPPTVPVPAPPLEQPAPPTVSILTVEVQGPDVAWVKVGDREWSTRPDRTIVEEFPAGTVATITVRADGFVSRDMKDVTLGAGRTVLRVELERVPIVGRRGPVRLEGHAFADDGGPWLSLGTTLFWALWGEKHDPERLDRNLAYAARNGVDYIRILSMVGAASWEERVIDPRWPDYWQVVDRLVDRAARHGLRLQVTVFADAQVMMPNDADRDRWADAWAVRVSRQPDRFTVLEAANEAWQNGFPETAPLARITKRLNDQTRVLVAPSAPACGTHPEHAETAEQKACVEEWRQLAAVSDLMTPHFDRDVSKADGYDRPIRQPWEMLFGPRELGVRSYVNNEPIGPQSSVAADDDPQRLSMAAAVTWLTQGAAYTLHTGAGIRGGSAFDLSRGRSANLWEVPHINATFAAIAKIRAMLPASLPNCRPANAHWADAPLSVNPDHLVRAYQSVCDDGTFVALPHGIKGSSVALTARRDVTVGENRVPAGASISVRAPSAVLVGRVH